MTAQKPNFYFTMQDGKLHFECVFCGDTPIAGHSTEYEYYPAQCSHPVFKALEGQGLLCSNCNNWDTDVLKRNPPRRRAPLKHKSGRFLGLNGWLDEQNESMERFFK